MITCQYPLLTVTFFAVCTHPHAPFLEIYFSKFGLFAKIHLLESPKLELRAYTYKLFIELEIMIVLYAQHCVDGCCCVLRAAISYDGYFIWIYDPLKILAL